MENLEKVFCDQKFPSIRDPAKKSFEIDGEVLHQLADDKEFIYVLDGDGYFRQKFHSNYIINSIGLLFTGHNGRFPHAMRDHEALSIPLLAAVCTLVSTSHIFKVCWRVQIYLLNPSFFLPCLAPAGVFCHRISK
jgi:hypothetical protein